MIVCSVVGTSSVEVAVSRDVSGATRDVSWVASEGFESSATSVGFASSAMIVMLRLKDDVATELSTCDWS